MSKCEPLAVKPRASSAKWVAYVEQAKAVAAECRDVDCLHWCSVGEYAPATADQIRKGMFPAFLIGKPANMSDEVWMVSRWDVTTVGTDRRDRVTVYVRWLGADG